MEEHFSDEEVQDIPADLPPVARIEKHFPIIGHLKSYSAPDAISDIIGGVTVGCMVVAQSLAYASIANLPPEQGLYSSFAGVIVYTLFGTSRVITVGPTAVLSLVVASSTVPKVKLYFSNPMDPQTTPNPQGVENAIALAFFSGFHY